MARCVCLCLRIVSEVCNNAHICWVCSCEMFTLQTYFMHRRLYFFYTCKIKLKKIKYCRQFCCDKPNVAATKLHLDFCSCKCGLWCQNLKHVDVCLKCFFASTETVGLLGTGAQDVHLDFRTAPDLWPLKHTPVFAFEATSPPNTAVTGYATEGALLIFAHRFTEIAPINFTPSVPSVKLVPRLWQQHSVQART